MNLLRAAFSILIFAISAVSQAGDSFHPLKSWQELSLSEQTALSSMRSASIALDFANGTKCSGTFVSNDGHIITAEHCLGGMLEDALNEQRSQFATLRTPLEYIFEDSNKRLASLPIEQYREFLRIDKRSDQRINKQDADVRLLQGLKIRARINGRQVILTYLGGGPGELMPFRMPKINELSPALMAEWKRLASLGYGSGGDFALLKADIGATPCLPLSTSSAVNGENISVMSATLRGGYSQDGERLGQTAFYSFGPDVTSKESSKRSDLPTSFRHAKVDADFGSSGSAAIGSDGSIKGVFTQCIDIDKRPYNPAVGPEKDYTLSSFIDVSFIRKMLVAKWSVRLPQCR